MSDSKLTETIIVTGTPSVGKTTVSRRLATKLEALHIDIGELVEREKLTSGYDKKRQTIIADANRLAKRVHHIIRTQKGKVIIDGHYAASLVLESKVARVFVLRCHPRKLRQRMKRRGFQGAKLWENLAAEILDVCLYDAVACVGAGKVCEIDTTNQKVDETVNEILSILHGDKECRYGNIDWLGLLEKEGKLDEYMVQY